jgi:3-phosphoshikimate 1-carboxyvinyltransferase
MKMACGPRCVLSVIAGGERLPEPVVRLTIHPGAPLRGRIRVPGDKSISHRALLLGALADGTGQVSDFLPSGDCLATLVCLRALGVDVEVHDSTTLTVHGRGLHGLRVPSAPLNCVRSGTTMRLLAGILVGQPFAGVLTGDEQLLRRPMRRIVEPLRRMGAEIEATDGHAPLTIRGRRLRGCDHTLPVASAQVKSALLLAGLYADGPTTVRQPGPARDHTERMLAAMGATIEVTGLTVTLAPSSSLSPLPLSIPGDISSAAFPLVAAALVPGSEVTIQGVGVNPTRTGLLDVLRAMGAEIALDNEREQGNEPVADVTVRASDLHGVEIGGDTVVRMIDEFPVLAVAATQARGTTLVRDAAELRVKETDRIATVVTELHALGARIEPLPDGFMVEGPTSLHGAAVHSHGDHRLAMALSVAGLIAEGEVVIENAECVADSFPGFTELMRRMGAAVFTMEVRET